MIFHIRNRVRNEMVAISAKNPPKVLVKFVLNEKKKRTQMIKSSYIDCFLIVYLVFLKRFELLEWDFGRINFVIKI